MIEARHILAVRLDNIGDVIMTGPALRAMKAALPQVRLTLLSSSAGAQAAAVLPTVDSVIIVRRTAGVDHERIGGEFGV